MQLLSEISDKIVVVDCKLDLAENLAGIEILAVVVDLNTKNKTDQQTDIVNYMIVKNSLNSSLDSEIEIDTEIN